MHLFVLTVLATSGLIADESRGLTAQRATRSASTETPQPKENVSPAAHRQEQRRGPRIPKGVRHVENINYAGDGNPKHELDLLLPESREKGAKLPIVVFVHGGAWRAGSRKGGIGYLSRFVRTGKFAGATISYRLSQEAKWPAQIHDCKAAIRWIRANSKKHGIDSDRIAVWGTSAGGHLVAMLGVTDGVKELEGEVGPHREVSSRVTCVIDFFGPTEFLSMNDFPSRIDHDAADSPESQLVGGPIKSMKKAVRSASPLTYVSPNDAPIFIAHGTKDPLVAFDQSVQLHKALEKAEVQSLFVHMVDGGHGFRHRELDRRIDLFIRRHLLGEKHEIPIGAIRIERPTRSKPPR